MGMKVFRVRGLPIRKTFQLLGCIALELGRLWGLEMLGCRAACTAANCEHLFPPQCLVTFCWRLKESHAFFGFLRGQRARKGS